MGQQQQQQKQCAHPDARQVRLDVERTPLSVSEKRELEDRVMAVLEKHPGLHYYQGFHDIAIHCKSVSELENVTLRQLRDFMTPNIEPTLAIVTLVPQLLAKADRNSFGWIVKSQQETVHASLFAVAPLLTLLTHDIEDPHVARRCIGMGLKNCIYIYAALCILCWQRQPVVDKDAYLSSLQHVAAELPRKWARATILAKDLEKKVPLAKLAGWKKISRHSVLKTSAKLRPAQAVKELKLLSQHAAHHQKRSPFGLRIALAIGVLAFGVFLRTRSRNPHGAF